MSLTAYSTQNRPSGTPDPSGPCDCHGIPAGGTSGQVLKKISNADYAAAWQNENGGIFDQNNIVRVRTFNATTSTSQAFASGINALPTFIITDKDLFNFAAIVTDQSNPLNSSVYNVVLQNLGKGTYGVAGTQVSAANIFVNGVRVFSAPIVEDLATTQTINLGNVGANDIVTAFNAHTFIGSQNPVQNQSQGYRLVSAIINGVAMKYLFTGAGGAYGVGGTLTAVADDFGLFKDEVDTVSGGGSRQYNRSRATTTQNVKPTAVEVATPKLNDTAIIKNGTDNIEYWTFGADWVLNFTEILGITSVNSKTDKVIILKEEDILGGVQDSANIAGNVTIPIVDKAHRIMSFNGANPNITFNNLPTVGNSFVMTIETVNTGAARSLSITNTLIPYGEFNGLSGARNFLTVMVSNTTTAGIRFHLFFSEPN